MSRVTKKTKNRNLSNKAGWVFTLLLLAIVLGANVYHQMQAHKAQASPARSLVDAYKERLSYMPFADEQAKLRIALLEQMQQQISAQPFSAHVHVQHVHQLLNSDFADQIDLEFSMLPAFRLAISSPKFRYYFANQCVQPAKAFVVLRDQYCRNLQSLLPQGVSNERAASILQVSLENLTSALQRYGPDQKELPHGR